MMTPFFTFIVPVYNVEEYLPECIDSVLKQGFTNYEVLLVNDNSTDNSLAICNSYSEKDDRVKVINKQLNEGLSITRNIGLDIAKGKYIIFLDSDDCLESTGKSLQRIYDYIIESDTDLLIVSLIPFIVDNFNNKKYLKSKQPRKQIEASHSITDIFNRQLYRATACDKIIKRSIIEKNNLRFPPYLLSEDITWCGNLLKITSNISYLPIDFYLYRKEREGSITYRISRKNIEDTILQLRANFLLSQEGNISDKYSNAFYASYYIVCLQQIFMHKEFDFDEAINLMEPMQSYLTLAFDNRAKLINLSVKIFGFSHTMNLLKIYLKAKK